MKYLSLLLLGLLITAVGVTNWKGNISTVHWYDRWRVSAADAPMYGKTMGIGTMMIGGSIALTAALQMIFDFEPIFYLTIFGAAAGCAVMLYAQFKYNRGIF